VKDDGSLVFNLGDKYEDSSLLLVPYRFAIGATEIELVKLVNDVTWVKKNPTPRQFTRRLVSSTEPFFHFVKTADYFYNPDAFMVNEDTPQKLRAQGKSVGQKYFELIDQSDLSEAEKHNARLALEKAIQEVRRGEIAGLRMKIRGIHAEAFGGQDGGRKIQIEKNGFTLIRLRGNKLKRDVLEHSVESIKGIKHPAIYPVKIVEEFLHLLTRSGDFVLDPFIGSGSTAVACKKLGRHFIGYDINPEYCEYAQNRVETIANENTSSLFENSL
jgi:site-specific DNA-methyltransferase (adenine-specific)